MIVGIRPSDFEDAAVWNRAGLPTIRVVPDVTEELGTEIHVIFTVDAPPVLTEGARAAIAGDDEEVLAPMDDRPRSRHG